MLGIVIAVVAGAIFAALHALFAVTLRADQIVSGTALNLLAIGITGYLYVDIYGTEGTPDDLPQVPDVRCRSSRSRCSATSSVSSTCWCGSRSRWSRDLGGRVPDAASGCGCGPRARTRSRPRPPGLSVVRTRYLAVMASGGLAAMGGAFLSIGFVHSFSQQMTAGRGFIALAALIFGRWRPWGALAATLLFGFGSALAQRLPVFSPSGAVLFQALPYVLTLIAVTGIVGRSIPPPHWAPASEVVSRAAAPRRRIGG